MMCRPVSDIHSHFVVVSPVRIFCHKDAITSYFNTSRGKLNFASGREADGEPTTLKKITTKKIDTYTLIHTFT